MRNYSGEICDEIFPTNDRDIKFCDEFLQSNSSRFVFGCTEWGKSIANNVDLDGFIDDFTHLTVFCNKPVIRSHELPKSAMVVSAVIFRPLTVQTKLQELKANAIDYFSFKKYSCLPLKEVSYLETFEEDFNLNIKQYHEIFNRLSDKESRQTFSALINFRLSQNLSYMKGFVDAIEHQYFEQFLKLKPENEVFIDVGCFDGYTSEEFIKRCPSYKAIHIFEPDPSNMEKVKLRLAKYHNIFYHPYGASNQKKTLHFTSSGSSSSFTDQGELIINVDCIDDIVREPFTFLKMDIEGSEISAIEGTLESIKLYHPTLAICVYHKVDDFWKIPKLILSCRDDYELYLRHYSESLYETVMFFIPKGK